MPFEESQQLIFNGTCEQFLQICRAFKQKKNLQRPPRQFVRVRTRSGHLNQGYALRLPSPLTIGATGIELIGNRNRVRVICQPKPEGMCLLTILMSSPVTNEHWEGLKAEIEEFIIPETTDNLLVDPESEDAKWNRFRGKRRKRAQSIKALKEENPSWSYMKMALELQRILDYPISEDTVRNDYRRMKELGLINWSWEEKTRESKRW